MYLQESQLSGIKSTLKKAAKIISAPVKDSVRKITHPVSSVNASIDRVKNAFKGNNPLDPFAAIASEISGGLRPIDQQLRAAGVKGGTATPADLANKALASAIGSKGKGFIGNKPATIVGAIITTAGFASAAAGGGAAGAEAAGGTGASSASSAASAVKKAGEKAAELQSIAKKAGDLKSAISSASETAPPISNDPTAGPVASSSSSLPIILGIGVLGAAFLLSRQRRA